MEFGPEPFDHGKRVEIDAGNKGQTVDEEVMQGAMAEILGDLFAHPVPELLNRIEIWTVGRELEQVNAQSLGFGLNLVSAMPGSAIPNDEQAALGGAFPVGKALKEFDRVLTIAFAFVPDEGLTGGEVIGPIPINARGERGGDAFAPCWLAGRRPGVAEVHVLVEMRFVDIEDVHLTSEHLPIERLELFNIGRSRHWVGLAQHFLAFLPTQSGSFEDLPQRIATDFPLQDALDPPAQLFQCPIVAGQPVLMRLTRFDTYRYLCLLYGQKRGPFPPVRR